MYGRKILLKQEIDEYEKLNYVTEISEILQLQKIAKNCLLCKNC